MIEFEFVDNTLVRCEKACTCEGGMEYTKRTPIITKEEFQACYKLWIESEAEE